MSATRLETRDVQQLFEALDDPNPGPASRAVLVLVRAESMWSYQWAADLWDSADPVKRCRLWRLLSSRGGWDRVRADLLAASDPLPAVSGLGVADLEAWSQRAAARMWRAPTDGQLVNIRILLPTARIGHDLRNAIEFRAGLPITPRPRQTWDHLDAVVLVALRGTGGLFRTRVGLLTLVRLIDRDIHQVLPHAALDRALGRLNAAALVAITPQNSFRLTVKGRQLVGSKEAAADSLTPKVAMRLNEHAVPEQSWILNYESYASALREYVPLNG